MVKNNFFELGYSGKAMGSANNLVALFIYPPNRQSLVYGRCGCKNGEYGIARTFERIFLLVVFIRILEDKCFYALWVL